MDTVATARGEDFMDENEEKKEADAEAEFISTLKEICEKLGNIEEKLDILEEIKDMFYFQKGFEFNKYEKYLTAKNFKNAMKTLKENRV